MKFIQTALKTIYNCAVGFGYIVTRPVVKYSDGTMGDEPVHIKTLKPDAKAVQWLLERRFPMYIAARRGGDDDAESYRSY